MKLDKWETNLLETLKNAKDRKTVNNLWINWLSYHQYHNEYDDIFHENTPKEFR